MNSMNLYGLTYDVNRKENAKQKWWTSFQEMGKKRIEKREKELSTITTKLEQMGQKSEIRT